MEGLGSRLGRASSRYGQTATVFNGPVRRWKKRWVHVSSSSPSLTYQNPHSQSNNNGNNSRLVLCRWTAISPANSPAEPAAAPDEPPRRKFRYTPVSVVEEHKKGIQKKVGDAEKTSEVDESVTPSDEMHVKPNIGQIMKEQDEESDENQSGLQDSNRSHLDLDLGLKGHSSNLDLIVQVKKGSSERFWLD
ncbi:hypothetical protein PS1_030581 [Malus domestica]